MASYPGIRCRSCGIPYTAFSTLSEFCSARCRVRAFRARRTAEAHLLAHEEAARGLEPSALRHLITEAQRLLRDGEAAA